MLKGMDGHAKSLEKKIGSTGEGHGRARQYEVAVSNFWVKFLKCKIFVLVCQVARSGSAKFLVWCFWLFLYNYRDVFRLGIVFWL